jgi:hypothetical protein
MSPLRRCALLCLLVAACSPTETRLPATLPFAFTRPAAGAPPTAAETAAFTKALTGFWREKDLFTWMKRLAHGLDASYDAKMPDYTLWWGQVQAVKAGDTVTFRHGDWDDNLTIEMSKLMNGVSAGYLATRDPAMRALVVGFAKGYSAFVRAMRWGGEAPDEFLWARSIFNHDHSYSIDGRKVSVDYSPVRRRSIDWNAHTVPNQTNPSWGPIWVRNIRSKDDVPHILRVAPWLARLVEDAPDADVRAAAAEALSFLQGFAKDTVAHAYVMRSKEDGQVFVADGDLASYGAYDVILPNGECDAKLTLSLLAGKGTNGLDCGSGVAAQFEAVSAQAHYYNVHIARYFHLSALANALLLRQDGPAQALLAGLAQRADAMATDPMRPGVPTWDADRAAMLVASASTGLPLTGDEARLVQAQFTAAAGFYRAWPYWDLWSAAIPDGTYPYAPAHGGADGEHPEIEELTAFLEYCRSPWRNPATVEMVDCAVVNDPSRWGQ